MQVKKWRLELDMEQQTGSKLGKEYVKAVYCHPAYLTYVQSSKSWEMLGWKKHKLESRLMDWQMNHFGIWMQENCRNINNLRYADDTTLMAESEEELKSFLTNVRGVKKLA